MKKILWFCIIIPGILLIPHAFIAIWHISANFSFTIPMIFRVTAVITALWFIVGGVIWSRRTAADKFTIYTYADMEWAFKQGIHEGSLREHYKKNQKNFQKSTLRYYLKNRINGIEI